MTATPSTHSIRDSQPVAPIPAQPPTQGQEHNLLQSVLSAIFWPVRRGASEASQGAVEGANNSIITLLNENEQEFVNRLRNIFLQAVIGKAPEVYYDLSRLIQNFLNHPVQPTLNQIKTLLPQISEAEIRRIAPEITTEDLHHLTTGLQEGVGRLLGIFSSASPPTVLDTTSAPLTFTNIRKAQCALEGILRKNEGAFQQILREMRPELAACVDPHLRGSKEALEAYQAALENNVDPVNLRPKMREVHQKLTSLLTHKDAVPQFDNFQWTKLDLFKQELDLLLRTPQRVAHAVYADLLTDSQFAKDCLTQAYREQSGFIESLTDAFNAGIGRGVDQLSRIFQNIGSEAQTFLPLQGSEPQPQISAQPSASAGTATPLRSTQAPAATPVTPPRPSLSRSASRSRVTPATPGATLAQTSGTQSFFTNLRTQGQQLISSLLSFTGDVASQQTARFFSRVVCFLFTKMRNHLEEDNENEEHENTLGRIDGMIATLQNAIEQSSWADLNTVWEEAFDLLQEHQVYIQGLFRVPLNRMQQHSPAVPEFLRIIGNHQNTLQPPEQRTPQQVSPWMIEQQKNLLESRLAVLGPTAFVAETLCGISCNEALYAELLRVEGEVSQEEFLPLFKRRLFEKIDNQDINFVRKWIAKRAYDLLAPISNFYVGSFIKGIFSLPEQWLQDRSRVENLVKLTRNWLAVTSGAYNSVADAPSSQERDMTRMMVEALRDPQRNGGLSQNELISAVAKTAIDTFGPRIKWSEIVENYFKTEIPPDSPMYFLNPLLRGLNTFCSFLMKTIVFIPQWLGNQILQGGAKLFLSRSSLLRGYLDQNMESLRRNTPASFAMQQVIYRQMQSILTLLQNSLGEERDDATNPLHRDTEIKKFEIRGMVEYLLEVVKKSRYHTPGRLRAFLEHHASLRDQINRELEEFALPGVMESAVNTISVALEAVTSPQEVQQTLYDSLKIANGFFENRQVAVSDEEFASLQKGMRELNDQILETAISEAIRVNCDFMNKKQKDGIARFVNTLKEQTLGFTAQLDQKIAEIAQRTHPHAAFLSEEISAMIADSIQYHRGRVDELGRADGNRNFHTETKLRLNQLCGAEPGQLLSFCNPIAEQLNQAKSHADKMIQQDAILGDLMRCSSITRTLGGKFIAEQLSFDDINFCKIQLALFQTHLNSLNRCEDPLVATFAEQHEEFSIALQKLEKCRQSEQPLRSIGPLFEQLKVQKLNRISGRPYPELSQLERQILQITSTLPFAEQRRSINEKILNLMRTLTPGSLDEAADEFSQELNQIIAHNSEDTRQHMETLREAGTVLEPQLSNAIRTFSERFVQNKRDIDQKLADIQTQNAALTQWARDQDAQSIVKILNLFPLGDMHWFTELVKNLAFDSAQSSVRELQEAFIREESYVGFSNQMLFLPFLRAFGRHHLTPER